MENVSTCTCGQPVVRCPIAACKIVYHSYTADPDFPVNGRPNQPSRPMRCKGWVHASGWHMCDPADDHTLLAEAA